MDEKFTVFKDEAAALEEIAAAGYFPLTLDFPAESNEDHWHDFDSLTYVMAGEVTITDPGTGLAKVCGAGTKIVGTRGFSIDPATLSQPINKPPPVSL